SADTFEVRGAEWLLAPSIYYEPTTNYPPEPATPEEWEVGIIQNLVRQRVTATYSGMPPLVADTRTIIGPGAILDAERPGTQAWMFAAPQTCPSPSPFTLLTGGNRVVASVRVTYGRGWMNPFSSTLLGFDSPRNVWNTSWTRDRVHWLERLEQSLQFRFWIAAKRVAAP